MSIQYSMEGEYSDCYFVDNLSKDNSTLRLTQEFNERFFNETRKSITITPLSIMKDDIKNYRTLTNIQLEQVEELSEEEKIEIIKTFNVMLKTFVDFMK